MRSATFRSLGNRNFRLYTMGQLVSVTGTAMQQVAQSWLVLQLTDSGVALGITVALQFLPMLVLGPWGGLLADRLDKRRLLIVTQVAQGVLSAALGLLVVTDVVTLWMVYLFAFLLGLMFCLDLPTRQSFVIEMVGPDYVSNAVALNSAVFNSGRLVGPAVGGVIIAAAGVGPCFLFNGLSFTATVLALRAMRPEDLHAQEAARREKGQVREGMRYAWRTPVLRSTLLMLAVVGTLGFNFVVVLPLYAQEAFGGGARLFGVLTALMGGGALVGALVAAQRRAPTRLVLVTGAAAFGISEVLVAVVPDVVSASVLLVGMGMSMMIFLATANSTLQLASQPSMRGRVMALYGLLFLGTTPVGGPIIGWISEQWGGRAGLAVGGVSSLAAAAVAGVPAALRRRRALEPVLVGGDGLADGPAPVAPAPGGGLAPGDPVEAA